MRYVILAIAIWLGSTVSNQAQAQTRLSVGIGNRGVSLGLVMSSYPTLVRIPGYPVYYDPQVDSNYFFYDGLYWVLQGDDWYSSSWYDGPWNRVAPAYVPAFMLRVPVRYYRRPPAYFSGWRGDAAPRWGQHWGHDWERQRSGWDRWDRRSVPRAAPLPTYQRDYSGSRYPRQLDQQRAIASGSYRYQPREAVSRPMLDQRRQGTPSRDRQQQQPPQSNRQPPQRDVRQQQDAQQQQRQQRNVRQQQDAQQQQRQQRNVRQQQDAQQRQQQPRRDQQQQRHAQPAQDARGADNKSGKSRPDRSKEQQDNKDGSGHP